MVNKRAFFILFLFVFIILKINFLNSIEIGISPEEISLYSYVGEKVCSNFSLIGEFNFLGEIKWSKEKSKELKDYVLSSEELGIKTYFPKEIKKGNYEVCFVGNKKGSYYGVILYKAEGTNYGVGTWIELNLKDNESILSSTGFVIKEIKNLENINKILILNLFLNFLVLFFLIYLSNKKRKKLV
ncbi:MAG: hypothetical protein KatS3mg093_350 [Candidatus Parcubacteria bacterium]|nr:MAG: hypothetical protein KatS3mg001_314 [Candidatus Pacearchaeota archaeon]GIW65371.1 MAG: hypothetical protein KatS3mg093_350 [Candidatus Parcubacteria bacterium]